MAQTITMDPKLANGMVGTATFFIPATLPIKFPLG